MNQNGNKKRSMSAVTALVRLPKIYASNRTNKSIFNQASTRILTNNSSALPTNPKIKFTPRMITQPTNHINQIKKSRITPIAGSAYKILQDQIQQVAYMFQKIHALRQQHGVVSYQVTEEQHNYDQKRQIPYNPQLHTMNEEICCIKRKIQEKMQNVLKIAKRFPKIRNIIEDTIDASSKQTLLQNERIGKTGAMKAHKRLILANQD